MVVCRLKLDKLYTCRTVLGPVCGVCLQIDIQIDIYDGRYILEVEIQLIVHCGTLYNCTTYVVVYTYGTDKNVYILLYIFIFFYRYTTLLVQVRMCVHHTW